MKDMSKKNFINACKYSVDYTAGASKTELNLFCEIMGLPKSKVNYFIADDPHGMVDIMEGYYCFNMTDIHVVISEYEHWMEIYKTNEELRKAVDAWYYYSLDWYEKHSHEEPRWVSAEERLPEPMKDVEIVSNYLNHDEFHIAMYNDGGFWQTSDCQIIEEGVWKWRNILTPEQEAERSKGCPNLRTWLAGCPVEGLREATPEWKEEQRKAQEAARQRVEECKQALYQAMEEEVKLNKF